MAVDYLSEEAKAVRREYARRWRAANKEKVRANNKKYWERRAEKVRCEANAETITAE